MIYLLDTNTCIVYLRKPLSPIGQRLTSVAAADVAISTVTIVELYRGAYRSTQVTDNLSNVTTFLASSAA